MKERCHPYLIFSSLPFAKHLNRWRKSQLSQYQENTTLKIFGLKAFQVWMPKILHYVTSFLHLQKLPQIRFFHIPTLHLLGQTFTSTQHNTLNHLSLALLVFSAFCFKVLHRITYLMVFRMVHLSFQMYHILIFKQSAALWQLSYGQCFPKRMC